MPVNQASELESLAHQLEELNRIGAALSAERDTARLLDLILSKARAITSSDAGSLYIVETVAIPVDPAAARPPDDGAPHRRLRFRIAQNDSVPVPFRETTI